MLALLNVKEIFEKYEFLNFWGKKIFFDPPYYLYHLGFFVKIPTESCSEAKNLSQPNQ
jgi:hypothetical protein